MAKKKDESSVMKLKEVKSVGLDNTEIDIDVSEIKNDLTEYMKNKIDKEVSIAVDKSSKRLIRYKNSIILRKNIVIIILLIICVFLGYNLYRISNINIDITTDTKEKKEVLKEKKVVKEEKDINAEFENNKKQYGHLIDDIFINDESPYIKDFYKGNLSDEVKLYLALNSIDEEKVISEDGTVYLEEDDLKKSYDNFFTSDFAPKSFEYNGLKFHFLSSKSLFVADGEFEKVKKDVSKEIIDINTSKNIVITTVEGIIKDDKLYNIISGEEVKNYKSDNLAKYENKLTKVVYYFLKSDDVYKIDKIEIKWKQVMLNIICFFFGVAGQSSRFYYNYFFLIF